jgi:hypothetical protein
MPFLQDSGTQVAKGRHGGMNGETVIMTGIDPVHTPAASRSLRTVAVVSSHPYLHALETVLEGMDHDVVFVEAMRHAYSEIKRVMPDLIVVCLSDDDAASCQVLSMLQLDADTARIPVLTYLTSLNSGYDEEALQAEDGLSRVVPVSMN